MPILTLSRRVQSYLLKKRRMPTFSIISSVYDHEAYVRQAVESVLAQTFTDWELILINDGSTDKSPALIDALANRDGRIKPVHQANSGVAEARNRGIAMARGEWIAYLDSDDLWFPHTLQTYAAYLRQRSDTQFLFGYMHRLRAERVSRLPAPWVSGPARTVDLFRRIFMAPTAVCHQRALVNNVGGFDRMMPACEDYDLFLRMSMHCDLEPLGAAIGLHRRHERNLSQRSGRSQVVEAQMLDQFAAQAAHVIDAKVRAERVGQVYARAARLFFHEGNYTECLRTAQIAQELAPTFRVGALRWLCRWLAGRRVPVATTPRAAECSVAAYRYRSSQRASTASTQ